MTYGRLLRDVAPQTGVARRPSTPTIQSAVLRAQALERGAAEAASEARARVRGCRWLHLSRLPVRA